MNNPPWSAEFASLKSDCANDIVDLFDDYPEPVVYEAMSELLRREMRDQFAGAFAESHE
ncbi:hypothetical protein C440_06657 [Haloferax mucosum ATCC BAA-1512]|uniref:Uncharacterized protein n=1 Tax=Haloferax mucosum ATCC BAA-1512 TaxID=662479 RepID=M0IGP2_9EURY|nr:hypothetical protein [Haloferax mucosum]ELZ95950.1 hypothetical protein C440_06657 [Haloferax mucosum ATCC BAA-1512]